MKTGEAGQKVQKSLALLRAGRAIAGGFLLIMAACGSRTSDGKGTAPTGDAATDGAGSDCRPHPTVDGAAVCSLPFEPGPCHAAFPVFAFVDGACVEKLYGGCDGNANRFALREQCMAACEGRPEPCGCPPGRVSKRICVACGPVGGCGEYAQVCATPCSGPAECSGPLRGCYEGACQATGCI
jgi:hypothetical protein